MLKARYMKLVKVLKELDPELQDLCKDLISEVEYALHLMATEGPAFANDLETIASLISPIVPKEAAMLQAAGKGIEEISADAKLFDK